MNRMKDERKTLRRNRLLYYAGRAKGSLVRGTALMMLSIVFDLLAPFFVGLIVDRELKNMHSPEWTIGVLVILIAGYLLCVIVASLLRYFGSYRLNSAANRIVQYMQDDAFAHLQKLPLSYFDNLPAGTVVSRITNDTKAVRIFFEVVVSQMLSAVLYAVGVLVALALIDYRLMLLALAAMPFIYLIVRDYRSKASQYSNAFRRAYGELNGALNENIQNMAAVQALNREDQMLEELSAINDEAFKQSSKMSNLYAYSAYNITQALQYVMLGSVLILFGYSQFSGTAILPIGNLYVFIDYMTKLFNQVSNGMSRIGDMERSFSAADHVFELLNLPEEEQPVSNRKKPCFKGSVCFENVTFAYKEEPVIKDLSFTVPPGGKIAFVGATGSGKSTIMNLLLGFYRQQEGNISFDGIDNGELSSRQLREHIAIVLQEPYLFTGTIYSNIALGDEAIGKKDAFEALIRVGGRPFLEKLSKGIDTPVQENGATFSAGERQLITFARALVRNPKILVLDEATSSIDSDTEAIIQQGIETLSAGRTTFMIAHRLSTIREADQILVLDKGRVVERGSHQELCAQDGYYRELLQATVKGGGLSKR